MFLGYGWAAFLGVLASYYSSDGDDHGEMNDLGHYKGFSTVAFAVLESAGWGQHLYHISDITWGQFMLSRLLLSSP